MHVATCTKAGDIMYVTMKLRGGLDIAYELSDVCAIDIALKHHDAAKLACASIVLKAQEPRAIGAFLSKAKYG